MIIHQNEDGTWPERPDDVGAVTWIERIPGTPWPTGKPGDEMKVRGEG